jgi:lysophospholipid acyltransferase (LPLAT)-like uncharacterized protein
MTPRPPQDLRLDRLRGRLLATGLRLLAATWTVEGTDTLRSEMAKWTALPLLVGFWHGKYFPLIVLMRGTRTHVFIGESRRGSRIAEICRTFGFSPVLLPHGDRKRAIERMRTALAGPLPCATALDGPIGPARQVKPTLIELATEVGATILPVSVLARPRSVLWWRWDRREVPWPFARVEVRVGEPIHVPIRLAQQVRAAWRERVRAALDELESVSVAGRIARR